MYCNFFNMAKLLNRKCNSGLVIFHANMSLTEKNTIHAEGEEGSTILWSFTTDFTYAKYELKVKLDDIEKQKKKRKQEAKIQPSACCLCTDVSVTSVIRGPVCVIRTHKASVRHLAESPPGANELEM